MQVQQLLEMGADVTAKDKKGISALHYASGQGRLEVLQFLWSKGLDLDADDPGRSNFTLANIPGSSCFGTGKKVHHKHARALQVHNGMARWPASGLV